MKHTRVVSTKCTPGFACRAFSDTTLVCFIVNETLFWCDESEREITWNNIYSLTHSNHAIMRFWAIVSWPLRVFYNNGLGYSNCNIIISQVMPQSHPTTGTVRFLTPVRFLARKAEWSARRNFTPVLLWWSHQATGPVRLAVHLCFDQIIPRIHMDPVRCPYGRRTGPVRESQMFFISYGIRTGPVRDPQWCRTAPLWARKGIDTTITCKNPARASYVALRGRHGPRTGPARAPHGLFTGCLSSLNPYGARKLIMHALKLYGPRTGGQNSYGAARAPWVDVRFWFKTAREQPVRGPGVWCASGISQQLSWFIF